MMSRVKSGDTETLKDILIPMLRKIQSDLNTLKEESRTQREDIDKILKSTNKMDKHIDFIHMAYEMLRSPLHLLATLSNRVTNHMDTSTGGLPIIPPSLLDE